MRTIGGIQITGEGLEIKYLYIYTWEKKWKNLPELGLSPSPILFILSLVNEWYVPRVDGKGDGWRVRVPPNSAEPPSISRGPSCTTGLWTLLPVVPIILLSLVPGDTGQGVRSCHWAEVVFSYSKTKNQLAPLQYPPSCLHVRVEKEHVSFPLPPYGCVPIWVIRLI